jgi:hypothetical protein
MQERVNSDLTQSDEKGQWIQVEDAATASMIQDRLELQVDADWKLLRQAHGRELAPGARIVVGKLLTYTTAPTAWRFFSNVGTAGFCSECCAMYTPTADRRVIGGAHARIPRSGSSRRGGRRLTHLSPKVTSRTSGVETKTILPTPT